MQTLSSSKIQSWLNWFLKGLLFLGFLVLLARLTDLQIIRGNYFRTLAEENRIRRVPIKAPRGKIIARGGEVLVGNREIKKQIVFDPQAGFIKLEDTHGVNENDILVEWNRDYKDGSTFAHIVGYLGEVNEDELGKIKGECPEKGPRKMGYLVGRSGLEQEYDCLLSGIDGEELVEVDSSGKKVRLLGQKKPVAGQDLKTSIHYGLQEKIATLLEGEKGAVVVSDTGGEILALYSAPSFDPNVFVAQMDNELVVSILNDSDLPLFNRSVGGLFHPGSVYKPIVAVAALEEGVIDEDFIYEDIGQTVLKTLYGTFTYANWYFTQYGGVEGKIDLTRALARSTDTFFYETGELLGIDKLNVWSAKFGLSEKTGIDIPGEISNLMPSPDWKKKVKGERWFLGNTYHMSIGQGDIALTPLSINSAIAAIASEGVYCPPHVANLDLLQNYRLPITDFQCRDIKIKKETIELVKEGMIAACKPEGTGFTFFDFEEKSGGVRVACKTGTAETDDNTEDTHAWFVAFAPTYAKELRRGRPSEESEIVVTVMIEKGGEGSKVAGPIAREIFDYWFEVEEESTLEEAGKVQE